MQSSLKTFNFIAINDVFILVSVWQLCTCWIESDDMVASKSAGKLVVEYWLLHNNFSFAKLLSPWLPTFSNNGTFEGEIHWVIISGLSWFRYLFFWSYIYQTRGWPNASGWWMDNESLQTGRRETVSRRQSEREQEKEIKKQWKRKKEKSWRICDI